MQLLVFSILLLAMAKHQTDAADLTNITSSSRNEKFMSLFSVVRFENAACSGSNSYNGTCMTAAECKAEGGTAAGSCAKGFGVCCTHIVSTCGATANRNCTYWQNPGGVLKPYTQVGQCNFYVRKTSSDICQIRLDFLSLTLNQPEQTNGVCTDDMFTVTSGASNFVPMICGDNDGQHMYLNAAPNSDVFELSIVTSNTASSRNWNIKITQLLCSSTYNAPDQCLQYFIETTGQIQSFNFKFIPVPDDSRTIRQLANQDYTMCIRMNAGFCGVCYSVCTDTSNGGNPIVNAGFTLTGFATSTGYSEANPQYCADYLQIPCANSQRGSTISQAPGVGDNTDYYRCVDRICGTAFASYAGAEVPVTVYSYRKPFELRFFTDSTEPYQLADPEDPTTFDSGDTANLGFCLTYTQQPCVATRSN